MSLYNMLHGVNPLAGPLLLALDLFPPSGSIDRFRDAALYNKDREETDYLIRVTTRTGGLNRARSQANIDKLTKHEYFLKEEDDAYDNTYMYFYFRMPPESVEDLKIAEETYPGRMRAYVENRTIKEMTDAAIAKIQKDPLR